MLDCEVLLFAPLRTTAARTVEETVGTASRSILLGHESPLKAGSSIDSTAASLFLNVLTWRPLLHPYVGHEKAVQAVRTTEELLPRRLRRGLHVPSVGCAVPAADTVPAGAIRKVALGVDPLYPHSGAHAGPHGVSNRDGSSCVGAARRAFHEGDCRRLVVYEEQHVAPLQHLSAVHVAATAAKVSHM